MRYEAPHSFAKQSALSDVVLYLSRMSWIEMASYIIVMSIFAYIVKKRLEKKV
jgi:hypothetical protein